MSANHPQIEKLILATYDSGYYSGQKRDGTEEHLEAISTRQQALKDLEADLNSVMLIVRYARIALGIEKENGLMRDLKWAEEWLKGDSPTYPIPQI